MSLFGFGKKKAAEEKTAATGTAKELNIGCLKVLGSGCKNCETLLANTKAAVAELGLQTKVEYVTDMAVVAGYGVMSTPALVADEKVVAMGKVLKKEEVIKLLSKL